MAIKIDVANETLDDVKAGLEESGHDVEVAEEVEETAEASTEVAEGTTQEKPVAKAAASKEETQTDHEDDETKGPKWYRDHIKQVARENRELKGRLSNLEREQAAKPTHQPADDKAKPAEKTVAQPFCGRPKPTLKDFEDKEDPYAELADALGDWHADEKIAKGKFEAWMAEQVKIQDAFSERLAEAETRLPDYAEVMSASSDDILATHEMQDFIYRSEVGHDILYYLAKNQEEFAEIAALTPKRTREVMLGLEKRIRKELKGSGKAPAETPKAKTVSTAPKPTTSVRKTADVVRNVVDAMPNDRIIDNVIQVNPDYEKQRREERRGRA